VTAGEAVSPTDVAGLPGGAALPSSTFPKMTDEPITADMTALRRRPGRAEVNPSRYFARRRRLEFGLGWAVAVLFVCLWQAVSSARLVDVQFFPAPSTVWSEGVKLANSGVLGNNLWISTQRVLAGFALGSAAGVLMGVIMGTSRALKAALDPLLSALYTVPKLALLPLLLLIFGIGELPRILLVAITVFFVMWLTTMAAFLSTAAAYVEAARSFGASRAQLFRHVQWPSALPQVFVGLRLSIGIAVLMVVGVEYVDASSGIGWLIWNSWSLFLAPQMYVGIVAVAMMGVIGTLALKWLARLLLPWAGTRDGHASVPF
jgi:ABC-type nitrate/sulfonate/bicarbonate transport system permease component